MSTRLEEMLQAECPEHKPVDKAPSFGDLTNHIENEATIKKVMEAESTKRYSAIDTEGKNIYLVQNPACMTYQVWLGVKVVRRPKPEIWRRSNGAYRGSGRRLLSAQE